jgi:lysophospholipase L1-like esterase
MHHLPSHKSYTCLALGDSYTIGENVPANDSFPNQLVKLFREKGLHFEKPVVIAKTGWTTDELQSALIKADLQDPFDLVTLLIGVNNQYRGRNVEEYVSQFRWLLDQSVRLTSHVPSHVIVLSIPDWGVTPFAAGRDQAAISRGIDLFNEANKRISLEARVHYIDITESTRQHALIPGMLTGDDLHPAPKEYNIWAKKIISLNVY